METEINSEYIFNNTNNKLNIDLLDTIDNKDLFQNLKIKNNNNSIITDNDNDNDNNNENDKQSQISNIKEEISNNNKNKLPSSIRNTCNEVGESNEAVNSNINFINFKDFISKKKNNSTSKSDSVSKSATSNKNKKILNKTKTNKSKSKGVGNSKTIKIKKENGGIEEEKIKKKKYTKERMDMNKQRLNNLYNDYQKIKTKIENKKKELSKDELKDCSFSPKINKYSKILIKNNSYYSKPIFLRNNNKKDKNEKKYENNFTVIPKINKTSLFVTLSKSTVGIINKEQIKFIPSLII